MHLNINEILQKSNSIMTQTIDRGILLHIPYKYIYGIAILSYIDMIISYFYGMLTGVKSEAKEAASGGDE